MKSSVIAPLAGLLIVALFGWLTVSRSTAGPTAPPPPPLPPPTASAVEVPPAMPARVPPQRAAANTAPPSPPVPVAAPEEAEAETRPPLEVARSLRLPVISAIRNTNLADDDKHLAMREGLARSGPSDEPWTREAASTFSGWARSLGGIPLELDRAGSSCYRGGCEMLVTFPDRAGYDRAASAFREISEPEAKHGGRVQTPPLKLPDGRVQAAWMLLRPDVPLPPGDQAPTTP